jgi:hypothetical protein
MEPTLEGFMKYQGGSIEKSIEKHYKDYVSSLRVENLTENMENMEIKEEKTENKNKNKRKCGNCGEFGHNKRTCPKINKVDNKKIVKNNKKSVKDEVKNKPLIVKEDFDVKILEKELYDLSFGENKCDMCNGETTNNMLCEYDKNNYCYTCYKLLITEKDDFDLENDDLDLEKEDLNIEEHEKNCQCIECKTIPLSPNESKLCNELLTEDKNDYIIYEGFEYQYDSSTNIIAYDYEELGIWDSNTESINWYNDECKNIHLQNIE